MTSEVVDDLSTEEPRWREFSATFEPHAPRSLADVLGAAEQRESRLEEAIAEARTLEPKPERYIACLVLLRDLHALGWAMRADGGRVLVRPHGDDGLPSKSAVRRQLIHGREDQLADPATRRFIARMESPSRMSATRSVLNVIADGPALAARLAPIAKLPRVQRPDALRSACCPFVQVASADEKDEATRQSLIHLWRYFRYTWASRHRRPPGRNLAFLVRDAAADGHPVMAIAALSSAVMQLTPRDEWAGWTPSGLEGLVRRGVVTDAEALEALRRRVREDVSELYADDLGFDAAAPPTLSDELDAKLAKLAASAAVDRAELLASGTVSRDVKFDAESLVRAARSPLFTAKRASAARSLLRVLRGLTELTSVLDGTRDLKARDVIAQALRQVKQRSVAASVMDITTCGAAPPYGPLLGGKLACLLMLSPFVRAAVRAAYADEPSVIASQMAGRPIVKAPELVMLTTTSLYPERSSQYNRVKLPRSVLDVEDDLAYIEVGRSQGHGSTNLSAEAEQLLSDIAASRREYRNVNFVFGEGQSPKMREMREATAVLGLGSADILQHGSPRIAYVAPLVARVHRALLGVAGPEHGVDAGDGVEAIAEHWRVRWLASRLDHAPALEAVASAKRISSLVSRGFESRAEPTAWLDNSFK
jgi:hypothetical protein